MMDEDIKNMVNKKLENIELSEDNIDALINYVREITDDYFDYEIINDEEKIIVDTADGEFILTYKGFLGNIWMDISWAISTLYEEENQKVLKKFNNLKLIHK